MYVTPLSHSPTTYPFFHLISPLPPYSHLRNSQTLSDSLARATNRNTRTSKATLTSHRLHKLINLPNLRCVDALENQLSDAIMHLDLEIDVRVVEEQDLYLAAVVGVDHAGTCVDKVLGGEAGAWGDSAV